MSDELQFLITVRFPSWTQDGHKFPAFGVKYLFITNLIREPDWEEDDDRWETFDEKKVIAGRFVEWYKQTIKDNFDGEILFIEYTDLSIANAKDSHAK